MFLVSNQTTAFGGMRLHRTTRTLLDLFRKVLESGYIPDVVSRGINVDSRKNIRVCTLGSSRYILVYDKKLH